MPILSHEYRVTINNAYIERLITLESTIAGLLESRDELKGLLTELPRPSADRLGMWLTRLLRHLPESLPVRSTSPELTDHLAFREEMRQRLLNFNMPLVHQVARMLVRQGWWLDDAISIGSLALLEAIDRFHSGRGMSFANFARLVIRQRMWDDAKRPGGALDRRYLGDHQYESLVQDPTDGRGTVETTLLTSSALASLDPVEKLVLERRYGLDGNDAWTLHQIARSVGVSHETIRRIERRALAKASAALAA